MVRTEKVMGGSTGAAVDRAVKPAIIHYLRILAALKRGGFLNGAVLYPLMGFDFFPALFGRVFGFNNRGITNTDFFGRAVCAQGVALRNLAQLANNLSPIGIHDIKNIHNLVEKLKATGFFEISGKKTIFLKGTLVDVFRKEFDPDTERYYPNPPAKALEYARSWLNDLLDQFRPGDYLVAFDEDQEMVPAEKCTSVPASPLPALTSEQDSLLIASEHSSQTTVYLPSQFRVFEIKGAKS